MTRFGATVLFLPVFYFAGAAWAQTDSAYTWGSNILCTWINMSIIRTYAETCMPEFSDEHQAIVGHALPRLRAIVLDRKLATEAEMHAIVGTLANAARQMARSSVVRTARHREWRKRFA